MLVKTAGPVRTLKLEHSVEIRSLIALMRAHVKVALVSIASFMQDFVVAGPCCEGDQEYSDSATGDAVQLLGTGLDRFFQLWIRFAIAVDEP